MLGSLSRSWPQALSKSVFGYGYQSARDPHKSASRNNVLQRSNRRSSLFANAPLNILGGASWRWPNTPRIDAKIRATLIIRAEIGALVVISTAGTKDSACGLWIPIVGILSEFQPSIRQPKPKFTVFSPGLGSQFAARFRLLAINLCGAPRRAFLCMGHAACWAFEGTQIGQSAKSLRSSGEFHDLSTAWAPRRACGIVSTHD